MCFKITRNYNLKLKLNFIYAHLSYNFSFIQYIISDGITNFQKPVIKRKQEKKLTSVAPKS